MIDVTATGKECADPQSEVCRELKTTGFLAIGPLGLMAGGPADHFTDSRELYVLVEGDEWAHVEALDRSPYTSLMVRGALLLRIRDDLGSPC